MKRLTAIAVLVCMILFGVFVSIGHSSDYKQGANLANDLIAAGLIVKHGYGDYYVDPNLWRGMDINKKEVFAFLCACHYYVYGEGDNRTLRSEIYDGMSGKKLAKYSTTWGFKALN